MSLTIPNTFQNKTGSILLSELDDNFNYIIDNIPEFDTTAQLALTNTTPSTSTNTGALTISGGVGIGGDLTAGGSVNIYQSLRIIPSNPIVPSLIIKNNPGLGQYLVGFAAANNPTGDLASTSILISNDRGGRVGIFNLVSNGEFIRTSAGGFRVPGTIVQVKTAQTTSVRQTISSVSPVAITGLSIAFTPFFEDSRIIIMANISGSHTYVNSYGVFKDGAVTVSTSGQSNNNEPNMHVTQYIGSSTSDYIYQVPVVHTEIAGSTNARTYAIYGTSAWSGTAYPLYINNRGSNDMASFSHMTIFEVCGG
jgi:hypothetical protein